MEVSQLDEILNLILELTTLIGVVPYVVVEMTKFSRVSPIPVSSDGLRLPVMNVLCRGHDDVLSGVYQVSLLIIL